jgi:hypothetical protein
VLSVFGVVAAERVQAAELHKVLCFDGTWVHPHNMRLLASAQTRTGGLAGLTRHNIRELESGSVLHTVAFEQFLQGVEDGAVFAAADAMHGPTSRLLLGQVLRVGTGTCTMLNADGVLVGGGSGRGRAGVGPVLLPHRLRVRAAAAAAAAAASAAMAKEAWGAQAGAMGAMHEATAREAWRDSLDTSAAVPGVLSRLGAATASLAPDAGAGEVAVAGVLARLRPPQGGA